jgi:hypothetical protein
VIFTHCLVYRCCVVASGSLMYDLCLTFVEQNNKKAVCIDRCRGWGIASFSEKNVYRCILRSCSFDNTKTYAKFTN